MHVPRRSLDDPKALRALAHPTRLRILELLQLNGPLTATEAAELVGESPANCSWHLRQLAHYGFVEESPGGAGRRRPWRVRVEVQNFDAAHGEAGRAGVAASTAIHQRELDALQEWQNARHDELPRWRDAGFDLRAIAWLTPDELAVLRDTITTLITQVAHRGEAPASRPADARPVRLVAWGVPGAAGASEKTGTTSEQSDRGGGTP
ncbi:ArsR/SmtB family transcription factor [Saccharothrix sp. HUAS TT1]|uniref:ArsR/SmtB family transcription factor n=1 Tax=unclassified Saccharothrix TaxID=2593673 RepID=UPI00345C32FD